jgi:peptidoglycan/LPS O-acetylase OafA/YrhL
MSRNVSFFGFWMGSVGISLWGLVFGGCLVLALRAQPGSMIHGIASTRWLRFFGKYSYCLYVCHQPLINLLGQAGFNGDKLTGILNSRIWAAVTVNIVAFVVAVCIALASWHLFEKHFLRLKDVITRT